MVNTNRKADLIGKEFQHKVAELYRLLGAQVDEDIEVCGKKVDLLVNFLVPGSRLRHRIIVECKAEKTNRAQNQRVMEFSGLLETARRAGDADSAEIISLEPWSEQSKGFARQAGIEVTTYEQKIRNLIDFSPYMSRLSESVHVSTSLDNIDPPLASYYVALRGTSHTIKGSEQIDDLTDYLLRWSIQEESQQRIGILGEYGSGKTSLCRMFAAELARQYKERPGNRRIPILLNLREYTKTVGIEALVVRFLDHDCGVNNPRYQLFDAMHKAGLFLIILDGFDEMASRTDSDTIELNLNEIEKLASHPRAKLIITTRPEYFATQGEQESAWRPDRDRILLGSRSTRYDEIVIVPWNDQQIDQFLEKRINLLPGISQTWEYYRKQIHTINDLKDLTRRPVLAEMVVKTLPFLIASGEKIDRLNLYNKYLLSELQRQKIVKRRRLLLNDENRLELLEKIAAASYQNNDAGLTFSNAKNVINKYASPPEEDLSPLTRDFLSCSFLVRRWNKFVFSHKSIQEYLTAMAFLKEIQRNSPTTFGINILDQAVLSFMIERKKIIAETNLVKWILNTRYYASANEPYIGGNAATLLSYAHPASYIGQDFSKVTIRIAKLCNVNLLKTDFTNSYLVGVDLRKASFDRALLKQVQQIEARVHLVLIGNYKTMDLAKLAGQLRKHFSPTVVKGNRTEFLEESSRVHIHKHHMFEEDGIGFGYFDVTLDGKESFDEAPKY
jgi:energy-coupling factor transporter ATP-binding protein EcfA2